MTSKVRSCWNCGREMPLEEAVRMDVVTGYGGGRGGLRAYSGRRTLCPECAARIRRRNMIRFLVLLAIVAGIVIWAVIASHH